MTISTLPLRAPRDYAADAIPNSTGKEPVSVPERRRSADLHMMPDTRPPQRTRSAPPTARAALPAYKRPLAAAQDATIPTDAARPEPEAPAPSTDERSVLDKLKPYVPAVIDAAAATCSLASSRLSSDHVAAMATGITSGVLWVSGAGGSEAQNSPRNPLLSGANGFGAVAGVFGAVAASLNSGKDQVGTSYTSAAAWGANALALMTRAVADRDNNVTSKSLNLASGLANAVAAGLDMAATNASANNDSAGAAAFGTASSVFWGAGAVATGAAAYYAVPRKREDSPV